MVTEHALITVSPGTADLFEAALAEARVEIAAARGFRSLQLHRGVEHPAQYLLLVEWETLDDHVEGFRGSEAFSRWRALIGPYFASPPVVEHYEAVTLPE